MIIFKIIFLQAFWFLVVLQGRFIPSSIQIIAALIIVLIDYFIFKPKMNYRRYTSLMIVFALLGFVSDLSLGWMKIIGPESYQFGIISLWIVFISYYDQIFSKFKNMSILLLSLIGGIGGVLAYWSAANLGAINIISGQETNFIISEFAIWAVFFPLSIKLYSSDKYWDYILDKTIFFSFDQTGYLRHKTKFTEDLSLTKISDKTALVTGGTSGIGKEAAASLSKLDVRVFVTGRNKDKGLAYENLYKKSKFVALDMTDWEALYEFAKVCEAFDYIVLNAGAMPSKAILNKQGVESQCASQLLGHYFLLEWLLEFKKIKSKAHVVWVTSGGMYLKQLDVDALFNSANYEKVDAYANVKRAQVTLVEELAKIDKWNDFKIVCMHPGWVATDAVKDSIPKFYNFMKNRLREPEEGADTIVWCLLTKEKISSGALYFDRKIVSAYISKKYKPTQEQRSKLLNLIEKYK